MRAGLTNYKVITKGFKITMLLHQGSHLQVKIKGINKYKLLTAGLTNQKEITKGFKNNEVITKGFKNYEVTTKGFKTYKVITTGLTNYKFCNKRDLKLQDIFKGLKK